MYDNKTTSAIAKKRYSFKKGYVQISLVHKSALKADLMNVLNTPSRYYFSTKLNRGITDISVTLYEAITTVFGNYGITDCWTITEIEQP